jgi:hypothetical protein
MTDESTSLLTPDQNSRLEAIARRVRAQYELSRELWATAQEIFAEAKTRREPQEAGHLDVLGSSSAGGSPHRRGFRREPPAEERADDSTCGHADERGLAILK